MSKNNSSRDEEQVNSNRDFIMSIERYGEEEREKLRESHRNYIQVRENGFWFLEIDEAVVLEKLIAWSKWCESKKDNFDGLFKFTRKQFQSHFKRTSDKVQTRILNQLKAKKLLKYGKMENPGSRHIWLNINRITKEFKKAEGMERERLVALNTARLDREGISDAPDTACPVTPVRARLRSHSRSGASLREDRKEHKKNTPTSRSSPPGGGSGRSDGEGDTKETRNPKSLPPFPTPPKASKASFKDLEEIDKADSPPAAQDGSSSAKDIAVAFHKGLNKRGLLTLNCKKPSTIPSWIKTIREIISYIKERDHTTLSKASTYLMELIQYHVEHIGEEYHPDFRSPTKLKGEHLNKLESAMKRNKKAGMPSSQDGSAKIKQRKLGGGKIEVTIKD